VEVVLHEWQSFREETMLKKNEENLLAENMLNFQFFTTALDWLTVFVWISELCSG
jgi:hypothetical protein